MKFRLRVEPSTTEGMVNWKVQQKNGLSRWRTATRKAGLPSPTGSMTTPEHASIEARRYVEAYRAKEAAARERKQRARQRKRQARYERI